MYLLYAVLYFWLRSYFYMWRHHEGHDVIWLHNPRLLFFLPSKVAENAVVTYHGPLHMERAALKGFPDSVYHRILGWIERLGIYRHRNLAYTAVSRSIVDSITDYGVSPDCVSFIGNGVNINRFTPGEADEPKSPSENNTGYTFVYAGRLAPEKGILRLLDVFEHLASGSKTLQLLIVGDGPQRDQVKSRVVDLPNTRYLGFIDHSEIVDVYRSADYLVLPSLYEGAESPLSLTEALSCGVPAFVSDIEALNEISKDGEEFVTRLSFKDPHEAANMICENLTDKGALEELGNRSRAYVKKHFSWEERADEYIDLLKRRQS